jgi:hypothetical protein
VIAAERQGVVFENEVEDWLQVPGVMISHSRAGRVPADPARSDHFWQYNSAEPTRQRPDL